MAIRVASKIYGFLIKSKLQFYCMHCGCSSELTAVNCKELKVRKDSNIMSCLLSVTILYSNCNCHMKITPVKKDLRKKMNIIFSLTPEYKQCQSHLPQS